MAPTAEAAIEAGVAVRISGLNTERLNGLIGVVVKRHSVAATKESTSDTAEGEKPETVEKPEPESPENIRWVISVMGAEAGKTVAVRQGNLRTARREPARLRSILGVASTISVVIAGMAHAAGPGSLICGLAPICSLVWFIATVATCYWLHSPLCANGILIPAISEMAISAVGRFVYQIGFGLCGVMLATTVMQLHFLCAPHLAAALANAPKQGLAPADPGIAWGFAAAGGTALQGICTLRLDFGWETGAHLGGAVLVLMGTMQHAVASNAWFTNLPAGSPLLHQEGLTSWGLWLRRDAMQHFASHGGGIFLLFLIPLVMQGAGRLGMGTSGHAMENGMGLSQWAIVACVALYFSTYTLDLIAPVA